MKKLLLALLLLPSLGFASANSIKAYILTQVPNNTSRSIAPVNIRNSFDSVIDNLSTISYTGPVSTSYITATAAVFGTVSMTGNISAVTINGLPYSGTPSWYSISGIPAQVQAVSNSGGINLSSLGVTGTVTASTVSSTFAYSSQVSTSSLFASVGVRATGLVTATFFEGNGSRLTGLSSSGLAAWVSWNGASSFTSTTAIIKGSNVRYVSRTAVGRYLITYTTPLSDSSPSIICTTKGFTAMNGMTAFVSSTGSDNAAATVAPAITSSSVGVIITDVASSPIDSAWNSCMVMD